MTAEEILNKIAITMMVNLPRPTERMNVTPLDAVAKREALEAMHQYAEQERKKAFEAASLIHLPKSSHLTVKSRRIIEDYNQFSKDNPLK